MVAPDQAQLDAVHQNPQILGMRVTLEPREKRSQGSIEEGIISHGPHSCSPNTLNHRRERIFRKTNEESPVPTNHGTGPRLHRLDREETIAQFDPFSDILMRNDDRENVRTIPSEQLPESMRVTAHDCLYSPYPCSPLQFGHELAHPSRARANMPRNYHTDPTMLVGSLLKRSTPRNHPLRRCAVVEVLKLPGEQGLGIDAPYAECRPDSPSK